MSRVHNYIIIPDILEDGRFIVEVNKHLTDETGKSNMFAPIENYAGGGKAFEAKLWAMAANYSPTPQQVIQALLKAEPNYPENLQFLFQTEDDERFTMLTGDQIKPDAAPF